MRQIILDTETTGLDPKEGHRIIEIGCVELVDRRYTGQYFHQYIRPDRKVAAGAQTVHGITDAFLADKPLFKEIVEKLLASVSGSELIIHNAPFDVGFLNHELIWAGLNEKIEERCQILDTLLFARKQHPGQRNSLDALCKRYGIDNTERQYHGALLDARILGDVYLAMTSGQTSLSFLEADAPEQTTTAASKHIKFKKVTTDLPIIFADADELDKHEAYLAKLKLSSGKCLWGSV